jgi:signal transduction histidine kinase
LLSTFVGRSQYLEKIDSLKTVISKEQDQQKLVDNYNSIANLFSHNKVDSALYYNNLAIDLAKAISYKKGQAKAYFSNSYFLDLTGNYNQAISSLENAIDIFIEIGDSSQLTGCYNNLGVLYSYGINQKKSLEHYIKSINISEALNDPYSMAESYCNIAGCYEELKEYGSALQYYNKTLDIDIENNSVENIAISHLDVGFINTKLYRYDQALEHLEKAQRLMGEIHDSYYRLILYHRFGNYYKEINNLDSALFYVDKAQNLCKNFDYPRVRIDLLLLKSEILNKQKNYKNSLIIADSAINMQNLINAKDVLSESYKIKSEAYSGLKMHNKAYEYLQLANTINEELKPFEIAEYLGEFEKEEALKEERARTKLTQELELQKNENEYIKVRSRLYFTIYLSILLGSILILALYFYALKRNHNRILESSHELINHQKNLIEQSYTDIKNNENRLAQLNATKDKFFSIIAHDLKNPFNTLIGISELMISNPEIKDSEDFDELMEGMFQTATLGHNLLENLLEWSRSQIGTIVLKPELISLDTIFEATSTFFKENAKAKDITISIPVNSGQMVYSDYNMTNFIIRNLLNNALKFSYRGSKIIMSMQSKDNFIIVSIEDFGIGIDPETMNKLFKIEYSVQKDGTANEKGTGLGLILCKEFVEKNKGEIWVESEEGKGSKFSFSLPKSLDKIE